MRFLITIFRIPVFLSSRVSSPGSPEIVGGSRLCLFPRMRERDSIWLMNTKRDTRPAIDYSLIAPELAGSNLSARHISNCNFPRFAITANYPSRETVRLCVYILYAISLHDGHVTLAACAFAEA